MPTFAIVRQDGEVDLAEGSSVSDVATRFGWPGNGTIEPYQGATHDKGLRHTFTDPDNQRELLADKPKASKASKHDAPTFSAAGNPGTKGGK